MSTVTNARELKARKLKAWEPEKGAPSLWEEGTELEGHMQGSEVLSIFSERQLQL